MDRRNALMLGLAAAALSNRAFADTVMRAMAAWPAIRRR